MVAPLPPSLGTGVPSSSALLPPSPQDGGDLLCATVNPSRRSVGACSPHPAPEIGGPLTPAPVLYGDPPPEFCDLHSSPAASWSSPPPIYAKLTGSWQASALPLPLAVSALTGSTSWHGWRPCIWAVVDQTSYTFFAGGEYPSLEVRRWPNTSAVPADALVEQEDVQIN